MAIKNVAFKPGKCAVCGGIIEVGQTFRWRAERGQRVHEQCANLPVAPKPSSPQRDWSSFQIALFDEISHGTDSLIVQAVAGSGKTSALEEAARRLPSTMRIRYLVFNKKNALEAQARMPENVEASTFHASCNAHLSQRLDRPKIDDRKVRKLLFDMHDLGIVTDREMDDIANAVVKLVGLAKNHGVGCLVSDVEDVWFELIEHFDINLDVDAQDDPDYAAHIEERTIEIARKLLAASNARTDVIDFDDMLYLTVKLHVALPRYDMVMVDESQDTNPIQRAILRLMLNPGGRLISIGDSRQAIYGFRGASNDAMDLIRSEFGCKTMPLPINYRCSKAVIAVAQRFCPEIQAHDAAPEGEVAWPDVSVRDFQPSDAILSRVTAPLITLAYRFLGNGIGCVVLGRDIGEGLVSLIKKLRGKKHDMTLERLEGKLDAWEERERSKWIAKGEDEKAERVVDKAESIRAAIQSLPEDAHSIDGLIEHLTGLFADKGDGCLTLATVHKSKGLEWERVFILDPDRMPSKWARKDWQKQQESHLQYVAATRAKVGLYYVDLDAIRDNRQ